MPDLAQVPSTCFLLKDFEGLVFKVTEPDAAAVSGSDSVRCYSFVTMHLACKSRQRGEDLKRPCGRA